LPIRTSPRGACERAAEYMKAVDHMRDGSNAVISGLLDQAESVLGSSVNMKRVGNLGAGSIAEGFEPVAMKRLIDGGSAKLPRSITRADIEAFGKKLDVSSVPGVSTATIEADCLLKDGTFLDMKHSRTADPFVSAQQVENLKKVLAFDPRPIQRAWFVTNGPVDPSVLEKIRQANEFLGEDLIKVIDDIGDFQ